MKVTFPSCGGATKQRADCCGREVGGRGAHFRGREVTAGFTEGRLLKLRPWGQKTPAKQTLGGNVPGPQRARGEKWHGMFEGPRSQGDGLDEARRESLGKGLAEEAEAGHLGPRGLRERLLCTAAQ